MADYKTFHEEQAERHIAAAMKRGDTRVGASHFRETLRPFLMDYTGLKEPTIKALQLFFTDTSWLDRPEFRKRDARALATRMLEENPSHHQRSLPYNQSGNIAEPPSAAKIQSDIDQLTQALLDASTPEKIRWFSASVSPAERGR